MPELSKIQGNAIDLTTSPLIASTGTFSSNVGVTGNISASGTLGVTGEITGTAGSFRAYTLNHSTTNGSAGSGSPTSTKIVRTGDNRYEYSFYFYNTTGGYPTCPNSYHILCPVQKTPVAGLAFAEIKIFGVHRGMWGTGYTEYARYQVGSGDDGGGIISEISYTPGNIRLGLMDYTGTFAEQAVLGSGVNAGQYTGNTISNAYYKMPIFFKIYTNCGADKEYMFQVTTTDPGNLGPPFKGPMWLTPNTVPTSAIYW